MNRGWLTKNGTRIVLHIISWVLFFCFPYLIQPRFNQGAFNALTEGHKLYFFLVLKSTFLVPLFYLNAYWLIPRVLYGKRPIMYVLVILAAFTGLVVWEYVLLTVFNSGTIFHLGYNVPLNLPIFVFIMVASFTFHSSRERMLAKERYKEQETVHLKTELSFLRSQISPHFMFNILNNMVALARKKSDVLEPSLIKLSRLLRYMLYETNESAVPLDREVEYLQSYIDLQKQRFGNYITIDTFFDVEDTKSMIEPMLLIPFVENAFKHGSGIDGAFIFISLIQQEDILQFKVQNHFEPNFTGPKDKTSGIGLTNVKRRLSLLYENNHDLSLDKQDNMFTACLTINLH